MKVYEQSPDSAIYFLAGSLPAEGYLHLRQFSLFGMICRLENNILKNFAMDVLTDPKPAKNSVFQQIQELCIMYQLPDAILLLHNPPPKSKFKSLYRAKVYEHWHKKLTTESSNLSSLRFLDPRFLSLSKPHPIWSSLTGNPYEARAAKIQALFFTGRYRTEKLCRFWSSNINGFCLQKSCIEFEIIEDLTHVLLHCSAMIETRRRLYLFTNSILQDTPLLGPILDAYLFLNENDDIAMQFLIDCSVLPLVIQAKQLFGDSILEKLFKITRTWCFSIHKSRMVMLGRNVTWCLRYLLFSQSRPQFFTSKVLTLIKHKCLLVRTINLEIYILATEKHLQRYTIFRSFNNLQFSWFLKKIIPQLWLQISLPRKMSQRH